MLNTVKNTYRNAKKIKTLKLIRIPLRCKDCLLKYPLYIASV